MVEAAQVPLEPQAFLDRMRSNQQVNVSQVTYYSMDELEDYSRLNPDLRDSVLASIAPLDLVKIASYVEPSLLFSLGSRDRCQCPLAVGQALVEQLPRCDLRGTTAPERVVAASTVWSDQAG